MSVLESFPQLHVVAVARLAHGVGCRFSLFRNEDHESATRVDKQLGSILEAQLNEFI